MTTTYASNEYLALYERELAHQLEHRGDRAMLSTAFGGPPQPWETCIECLHERKPPRFTGAHGVKVHYSWAVPNDAALQAIAGRSPRGVVEIGAGGGYWAMLLRQRGVDVMAYDPHEPGGDNRFADNRWDEVLLGDHTSVIGHPDRTLLLCWPSYSEPWTSTAVDLYDGDTIIYIGEPASGCTGDDRMHALLGETPYCPHYDEPCTCDWPAARFKQVDSIAIPQWQGLHDVLFVYERLVS